MSQFEKNIQFKNTGLEQVETLYKNRKENYGQNRIQREDKKIIEDVIDDIFEKEKNKQLPNIPSINPKRFEVFNEDHKEEESITNKVLEELLSKAFEKGIANAVKLSFKTSNPYLLDKFHDLLVDKAYKALVERKVINK